MKNLMGLALTLTIAMAPGLLYAKNNTRKVASDPQRAVVCRSSSHMIDAVESLNKSIGQPGAKVAIYNNPSDEVYIIAKKVSAPAFYSAVEEGAAKYYACVLVEAQ